MSTKSWPTPGQLADALESGRYGKGRHALVDSELHHFCCLGVAACEAGYTPAEVYGNDPEVGRTYLRSMYVSDKDTTMVLGDAPDWMDRQLERALSLLNDGNPNWGPVIEKLRSLENDDV